MAMKERNVLVALLFRNPHWILVLIQFDFWLCANLNDQDAVLYVIHLLLVEVMSKNLGNRVFHLLDDCLKNVLFLHLLLQ